MALKDALGKLLERPDLDPVAREFLRQAVEEGEPGYYSLTESRPHQLKQECPSRSAPSLDCGNPAANPSLRAR